MKIIIILLAIALLTQTFRVIMLKRDIEHLKIRIRVMRWVNDMPKYENPPPIPEKKESINQEMAIAIELLVKAQDRKKNIGKDLEYENLRSEGWDKAFKVWRKINENIK